jgi:hypothetical protein
MIKFSCLCGAKFSLDDNMAGEMLQCEKCSRLVVVPTLDDLQHLKSDGTYDVDLTEAASKRPTHAPVPSEDQPPTPLSGGDDQDVYDIKTPQAAPRYDPFTGELIRPLEVGKHTISAEAQKPAPLQPLFKSSYEPGAKPPPPMAWLTALGEMFLARNILMVLLMATIIACNSVFLFFVICVGFFVFAPIPTLIIALFVGYFPTIIQETGPEEKDELPVPMRSFDLRTDIWDPILFFFISAGVCLGPGLLVVYRFGDNSAGSIVGYALCAIGAILFPPFLLVASVDAIVSNFRPDRLLGVIAKAKLGYVLVLATWTAGAALLGDGCLGLFAAPFSMFKPTGKLMPDARYIYGAPISFGLVLGGMFLTSYGCWVLGLVWRKHHADFPWIGQRISREKPIVLPPRTPKAQPKERPNESAPVPPRHTS